MDVGVIVQYMLFGFLKFIRCSVCVREEVNSSSNAVNTLTVPEKTLMLHQ